MQYFAMQVATGDENEVKQELEKLVSPSSRILMPMRELIIRKKGRSQREKRISFPGYLFLEIPQEAIPDDLLLEFKRTRGFFQFLRSNRDIVPLNTDEIRIIRLFLNKDETAGISQVRFDENNKIVVLAGPLKGLEGRITKVDRRKQRATILLDLYKDSHPIDLGFEVIRQN